MLGEEALDGAVPHTSADFVSLWEFSSQPCCTAGFRIPIFREFTANNG